MTCDRHYPIVDGVPVIKNNISEDLDLFLSDKVYKNKSRIRSLNGEDLYFEQSQVLWNYLPEFVNNYKVNGPSLEIGCGLGIFAERVPQFVGLDYSIDALLAEGFECFERVCASGELIPFSDETYELIFSLNTLEHVPLLDHSLKEIDRVLKPGGFLILKPAWNCMQYNCDGVPYLPFRQLSLKNRIIKLLLPILTTKVYKAVRRVPSRIFSEYLYKEGLKLRWTRLKPRFDLMGKVADAEAFAQIDVYECIRWFTALGYQCISHPTMFKRVTSGHDIVCLKKPFTDNTNFNFL